jgi:hypothetical protein
MPSSSAPHPDASSWYGAAAAMGLRALAARRLTEGGEGRYSGRRSPALEDDVPYRRSWSWSGRVSEDDDDTMASRLKIARALGGLIWSGLDALVCRWVAGWVDGCIRCMPLP